jgi:hypothetical protein
VVAGPKTVFAHAAQHLDAGHFLVEERHLEDGQRLETFVHQFQVLRLGASSTMSK